MLQQHDSWKCQHYTLEKNRRAVALGRVVLKLGEDKEITSDM